jgi:hypothetical protein
MEGVQAAMTTRNLETDQWRNREDWRLVCGRWRQLLKKPDRQINIYFKQFLFICLFYIMNRTLNKAVQVANALYPL